MKTRDLTVLPLASADAPLSLVGGKARSLAKLAAAGLPVPDAFLVSTTAYRDFVEIHDLQRPIHKIVTEATSPKVVSIESASARIRSLFEGAGPPPEIATAIVQAYTALGEDGPAVAVRSSATAEDLPEFSFAGQQDTYLNVRGAAVLLETICHCWASLWTARAIAYRAQMDIDQRTVAMGVVVQRMVPADVSGILFTANPASGDRSQMVVNSSFGLGEAVVAAHVTPDTYLLDRTSFELKETRIGSKEEMVVSAREVGTTTQPVPEAKRQELSLSKELLNELALLSVDVERLFDGVPQDIEWAAADGKCWLLQSRPITNLPPPPLQDVSWDPPAKGTRLIRRQVVENMPDPLSPLFAELYLQEGLERSIDKLMADFKMPFAFEDFMDRPMFVTVNGYAYCRANCRSTWKMLWIVPKILCWYAISFPKILRTVVPHWRDEGLPAYLATIERWESVDPATAADQQLLSGVHALTVADAVYWFNVAVVLAAAKITDGMLNSFLKSWAVRGDLTSGMFLRGFPSKTVHAQEDLEAIARRIHPTKAIHQLVVTTPAKDLLQTLTQQHDGHWLLAAIEQYLEQFGHQVYTLDFAQPTQREDPLPVLLNLKELVKNEGYNTVARRAEMCHEVESRVQETAESLGPLRRWLFRKLLRWAQDCGPYREEALFYMGAAWPTLRRMALEMGERLVDAGTLKRPEDVFYLESAELIEACTARKEGWADSDLGQTASCRRELRAARRKLHPPGMVPEKSKFKVGPFDFSSFETQKRNPDDSNQLEGFAVSPGKVTGVACVILAPHDFEKMEPDTILVCPTTTPAWTPLFAQALGLATDMGGILAHGSIVAREYGIPAVMGTGNVTRRIVSGQRITVDGDEGTVTILE